MATGLDPFPFQVAFHQRDRIPTHTLSAPTGLGKTECLVVDWLYGILYDFENTPIRLVFCLPMRSLTHQTRQRVEAIVKRLDRPEITIHSLVGGTGTAMDRDWLDAIDRPCIILGTQDQILSRQLFRGYACSRWEWVIHGALLNNDVRVVMDETQLMGVGYLSAILLQQQRLEKGCYGRSELILCSATLDVAPIPRTLKYGECKISQADYQHPIASQKLGMHKRLHRVEIGVDEVAEMAQVVVEQHIAGALSLCIVNRVQDCIEGAIGFSLLRSCEDFGGLWWRLRWLRRGLIWMRDRCLRWLVLGRVLFSAVAEPGEMVLMRNVMCLC
ncbi:MAG: DEAD/DEAH box helicase [Leptolyngbya sp. Prado105]|nr:DEAD/DEAH box helicase [Leptolyngbya sp. Prado105]